MLQLTSCPSWRGVQQLETFWTFLQTCCVLLFLVLDKIGNAAELCFEVSEFKRPCFDPRLGGAPQLLRLRCSKFRWVVAGYNPWFLCVFSFGKVMYFLVFGPKDGCCGWCFGWIRPWYFVLLMDPLCITVDLGGWTWMKYFFRYKEEDISPLPCQG